MLARRVSWALLLVSADVLGVVGTTVQPAHASLWLNGGADE